MRTTPRCALPARCHVLSTADFGVLAAQIPQLRQYIVQLGSRNALTSMQALVHSMHTFVTGVESFLGDDGTHDAETRARILAKYKERTQALKVCAKACSCAAQFCACLVQLTMRSNAEECMLSIGAALKSDIGESNVSLCCALIGCEFQTPSCTRALLLRLKTASRPWTRLAASTATSTRRLGPCTTPRTTPPSGATGTLCPVRRAKST